MMKRYLLISLSLAIFPYTNLYAAKKPDLVAFQVIAGQVILDNTTVDKAAILPPKTGRNQTSTYALEIELNDKGSQTLQALTSANVGKNMAIVVNDRIIQTSTIQGELGGAFMVSGLNKDQATNFIEYLNSKAKSE